MRRFMRAWVEGARLILHFLSRISWNFTYRNVFIKIIFTIQRIHRKTFMLLWLFACAQVKLLYLIRAGKYWRVNGICESQRLTFQ